MKAIPDKKKRDKNMLNFLRHIKHSTKTYVSNRLTYWAEARVYNAVNGRVFQGPFKDLKLTNKNVFGSEIPKLLGCYEKEINTALISALAHNPKVICNIGAAEGYYALGCAKYQSVKKALVFEALELGQELIRANLQANAIDAEVEINGLCDEQMLWETLNNSDIDLMLIDIEGAELDILSSRNVKLLRNTELVIESHDFCRPECISSLKRLFRDTHDLTVIDSKPRIAEDFPPVVSLPRHLKLELMNENRPGVMQWLVCSPPAEQ